MKLSQGEMFDLMAYADGELDGEAKAKVERRIAEDADARRVVAEMGALGAVVQKIYAEPEAALSAGIADAVMAKIGEAPPPKKSVRPPKVVDLRAERERRIKMAAAIVAAVALAAGVVLTTKNLNNRHAPVARAPAAMTAAQAPGAPGAPEQRAAAGGVDVEQVDSPKEVSVFYLPSAVEANASSVVVWIEESP